MTYYKWAKIENVVQMTSVSSSELNSLCRKGFKCMSSTAQKHTERQMDRKMYLLLPHDLWGLQSLIRRVNNLFTD